MITDVIINCTTVVSIQHYVVVPKKKNLEKALEDLE